MILNGVHLLLPCPCTTCGRPAGLAYRHGLKHEEGDADACQFSKAARRSRFPEILGPDAMYSRPDAEKGQ